MAAARGSRGLGMSKADLEASRLVFVYLANSKPKRKVAIPVPDTYTWEQFLDQVKARLRLAGVRDIYLASTGTKVRSVGELQDIDELCVVEAPTDEIFSVEIGVAEASGTAEIEPQGSQALQTSASLRQPARDGLENGRTKSRSQNIALERHRSMANGTPPGGGLGADREDDKYARRAHPLKRTMQRLMPGLFPAASLPLSSRDLEGADGGGGSSSGSKLKRSRRSRRSRFNAQNVLALLAIMSCLGTMVFFFARVSKNAPGSLSGLAPGGGPRGGDNLADLPPDVRQGIIDAGLAGAAAARDHTKGSGGGGGGAGGGEAGGGGAGGGAAPAGKAR